MFRAIFLAYFATISVISAKVIPARDLGIFCDGRTDDTLALNQAISSLQDGDTLQLPPDSICPTTNILSIKDKKNIKILGGGPGSVIQVRRPALGAIFIQGSLDIILDNFKHSSPYARTITFDRRSTGITVNASSEVLISRIVIEKSADIGIYVGESSNVRIESCGITETLHNGIHIQRVSRNVTVQGCALVDIERDGLSVVDWNTDVKSREITFQDNSVVNAKECGIRIATAEDVIVERNHVLNSKLTGIQLQCAPPDGNGITNALISENIVENSPREPTSSGEAGIRANTNLQILENITIQKNVIKDPKYVAGMAFNTANSGFIDNLNVLENTVIDEEGRLQRCVNDILWSAIGYVYIGGNTLNRVKCPEGEIA